MFKEVYKSAYDKIIPESDFLIKIEKKVFAGNRMRKRSCILRPVLVTLVFCLVAVTMGMVAIPVAAKEISGIYRIIERYAPSLADSILPEVRSSSSQGIKLQVEAVNVEQKEAEIVISLADEEGFNYINGPVDLYDSYNLHSCSGVSNVGGCSFLEYDAAEDKAYFKIQLSTWDEFDSEKLCFSVRKILTRNVEEIDKMDLTDISKDPVLKQVTLNGYGGSGGNEKVEKYLGTGNALSHRKAAWVMDVGELDQAMTEQLTVTGIAYADGILRVQSCRGDLQNADRVVLPFLTDADGTKRYWDYGVHWNEEIGDISVSMEERWFLIGEEELKDMELSGEYIIRDGCVEGDWEVIFKVR